ncbi:MAG: hypothetical protein LBP96_00040, partial [Bacteroidales bacterium]|nr:hypothetical protein [Bacteroidales bacterium]
MKTKNTKTKIGVYVYILLSLAPGCFKTVEAQTQTITIVPNEANTGTSSANYITTLTNFEAQGAGWAINNWNPRTLQVRANATAGQQFQLYNTTAVPGVITKVAINVPNSMGVDGVASPGFNPANMRLMVGNAIQSGTAVAGGIAATAGTNQVFWEVSGEHSFFRIQFPNNSTLGTALISSITIEYEETSILKVDNAFAFGSADLNVPSKKFVEVEITNWISGNIDFFITDDDDGVFSVAKVVDEWDNEKGGTLEVTFTPTAEQNYTATLVITNENADTVFVALTGTGSGRNEPYILVSTHALNFGDVFIDADSVQTMVVTIGNLDEADINYIMKSTGLTVGENFTVALKTDWTTHNKESACTLNITFAPTTNRPYNDTLIICGDDAEPRKIVLTGKGIRTPLKWTFSDSTALADNVIDNLTSSAISTGNPHANVTTPINTTSPSVSTAGVPAYPDASGTYNYGLTAKVGDLEPTTSTYVQFTITPSATYGLDLTGISFGARSTATGAQVWALRSNKDDYTSDIASGTIDNSNTNWRLYSSTEIDFKNNVATAFRIYLYGGTGSPASQSTRLDDIRLDISAYEIPALSVTLTASDTNFAFDFVEQGVSAVRAITVASENLRDDISFTLSNVAPTTPAGGKSLGDADAFIIDDTEFNPKEGGVLNITFTPTEGKDYTAWLTF